MARIRCSLRSPRCRRRRDAALPPDSPGERTPEELLGQRRAETDIRHLAQMIEEKKHAGGEDDCGWHLKPSLAQRIAEATLTVRGSHPGGVGWRRGLRTPMSLIIWITGPSRRPTSPARGFWGKHQSHTPGAALVKPTLAEVTFASFRRRF